mmetsp:Transcript_34087/g.38725  ORF Transcript_34087/g.38725 Transcript_34087/m.38725 type:complete len:398 (+) Transcript_34087:45-1238(+)
MSKYFCIYILFGIFWVSSIQVSIPLSLSSEDCHFAATRCFTEFLNHEDQAKYDTCLSLFWAKFNSENHCTPCEVSEFRASELDLYLEISSQNRTEFANGCYANCYHENLYLCDSEHFLDCLWECVAQKKLFLKTDSVTNAADEDLIEDLTTRCQTALVECYRKYLEDFDQNTYLQCEINASQAYGMEVCSPCWVAVKGEHVVELPKVNSVDVPIDCLVECYLEALQVCPSAEQNKECYAACYSPPTPERTEECQTSLLDCLSEFLDTNDFNAFQGCQDSVFYGYGYYTCMPCHGNRTEDILSEPPEVSKSSNKACILECYKQYMNDCDSAAVLLCTLSCHRASSTVVVEPQQGVQSWTAWIVSGVALICLSVFAGLVLGNKTKETTEDPYQYRQLIA